jgi:hypothetical protein
LLQIIPETEGAELLETICEPAYFDWQLLPPPRGAEVKLYGFPKAEITSDGKDHVGQIPFVEQDGVVEDIFEPIRTHRMLEFPCYRISKPVDHGFSGGPVFCEGKLAGIVSAGSSYDPHTWIASLWPLALLTYGLTGQERRFSDLLDSRVLLSQDWENIRDRVDRYDCTDCPRQHARRN